MIHEHVFSSFAERAKRDADQIEDEENRFTVIGRMLRMNDIEESHEEFLSVLFFESCEMILMCPDQIQQLRRNESFIRCLTFVNLRRKRDRRDQSRREGRWTYVMVQST